MWPFRRKEPSRSFWTRLDDLENAIEDLRRKWRAQDLDLNDALEKMQRLSARLARRAQRAEDEQQLPPPTNPNVVDPISARILARRMAGKPPPRHEEDDGVLPGR